MILRGCGVSPPPRQRRRFFIFDEKAILRGLIFDDITILRGRLGRPSVAAGLRCAEKWSKIKWGVGFYRDSFTSLLGRTLKIFAAYA